MKISLHRNLKLQEENKSVISVNVVQPPVQTHTHCNSLGQL